MSFLKSLRARVAGYFALVGLAIPVILGGGLWLASERLGAGSGSALVLFGGGAGFALVFLIAWTWQTFDSRFVAPLRTLQRDMETITHANPDHEISDQSDGQVPELGEAALGLVTALKESREQVEAAIANATQLTNEQKGRLETILRELHEGVLICNLDNQVAALQQARTGDPACFRRARAGQVSVLLSQ